MDEHARKFKELFIGEALGQLSGLSSALLELEKDPQNVSRYAVLMRGAHTLKSAAATMGFNEMATLSHALEDVFHAGERGAISLSPAAVTVVFRALDALNAVLVSVKEKGEELSTKERVAQLRGLLSARGDSVRDSRKTPASDEALPKFRASESVKVDVAELDALMGLFEEMLLLRLKLDTVLEPALDAVHAFADPHLKQKFFFVQEFKGLFNEFARLLKETQEKLLSVRLVPLEQIFGQFPRMVRDLSLQEGKRVEFRIEGAHVELDRFILDGLGGALAHLLRNAIDHGVQKEGTIILSAQRSKDRVEIAVEDTGGGIDYVRLKEVAVLRGVIEKEKAKTINRDELALLLFHPNLSTNTKVTEISGRGVGLFAVKEFVQSVGGHIFVSSPLDGAKGGTRFVLDLPISIATLKVLIVEVRGFIFAVPFADVVRTFQASRAAIMRTGQRDSLVVDKQEVPLLFLDRTLGLSFGAHFTNDTQEEYAAVLLAWKGGHVALLVDRCLDERELLVKALPPVLRKVRGFSGSALIPDGRTILLLDIHGLLAGADSSPRIVVGMSRRQE